MNFKIIITICLILFLIGCTVQETPEPEMTVEVIEEEPEPEPVIEEPVVEEGCTHNNQCDGKFCIDNKCGTIDNLYKTEGCDIKCNFNDIVVETSDDQTFTLNRGKGDYTSAGAIEWILSSGPDYCQGEEIIVPVKILKKNYGKIVNEEYVTVKVDELSPVINHPNIESLEFTFKVTSVNEVCE